MEKTGKHTSARNLRIWEPGPLKLLPLCSWAAVARSCEAAGVQKHEPASAEAPGDSAGGPQPPCCLPGYHACHLAPFRGGLSENWSPEELWFVFTWFLGPGLPFGMEGEMLETGECDSPVCPVMESEKLEIYLDGTLSQPKPKYLYKIPRSEQTAILWQKYSVWEFLTRSGSKHLQGVICAWYRAKIIWVPGALGGKMREWKSKLKGLKQKVLIIWARLTKLCSAISVWKHTFPQRKQLRWGPHPSHPARGPSVPSPHRKGLCRLCLFLLPRPRWDLSRALLLSSLLGFYGRADPACEPTAPAALRRANPHRGPPSRKPPPRRVSAL